jgi:hypothetical protein
MGLDLLIGLPGGRVRRAVGLSCPFAWRLKPRASRASQHTGSERRQKNLHLNLHLAATSWALSAHVASGERTVKKCLKPL